MGMSGAVLRGWEGNHLAMFRTVYVKRKNLDHNDQNPTDNILGKQSENKPIEYEILCECSTETAYMRLKSTAAFVDSKKVVDSIKFLTNNFRRDEMY
jgi:hypothetical protein